MNRRDFLGLGFGFLCAPALGDATESMEGRMTPLSPTVVEPWNQGVLRVSSFSLKVGATAPFRAVHFSDTHVNLSDIEEMYATEKTYKAGVSRYARFPQAIPSFYATLDYAAKEPGTVLLHTGDLIDFGTRACYSFVRHNVCGLDLHYAVGNHEYENPDSSYNRDDPDGMLAKMAATGVGQNLRVSARTINGVDFVAFDNARFGRGVIDGDVIAAVEREFEKGLPVVLMCHVPPYLSRAFRESKLQGQIDYALQRGKPEDISAYKDERKYPRTATWIVGRDEATRAFWQRVRERDNFKAVLCGHCHWPWHEPFGKGGLYMAGGNYEGALNVFRFA